MNSIFCAEDDYESDYEILDETDINLNDSLAINGTADDYEEDYNEYEDEEECTVDAFIDHYSELILPDDYEEGKQLDFTQKSFTFSETISRIKRLHQYQQNVTRKIEPILKRVMPRLSEFLFYIDLPSDCMVSLVRIGQAAKDGERWAMKCKLSFLRIFMNFQNLFHHDKLLIIYYITFYKYFLLNTK